MKKLFLALVLVALIGGLALLALGWALAPPAHAIRLVIDGQDVRLADLHGWHAAAGGLGVMLALCVAALAVPLGLLLALLLPLLLVLGAVLLLVGVALGVGALALAPLLLPLLFVAWLWRRSRRTAATARPAGTTIGA
jgi:hypothetical protein